MYERIKQKLLLEIQKLNNEKANLHLLCKQDIHDNNLLQHVLDFKTRQLMLYFINRIEIHKDKIIDVYLNFRKPIFLK